MQSMDKTAGDKASLKKSIYVDSWLQSIWLLQFHDVQMDNSYRCPHFGCVKQYARKYRLKQHLSTVHGMEGSEYTRNFKCPFNCGVKAYRTNKELLTHCDKDHQDALGKLILVTWLFESHKHFCYQEPKLYTLQHWQSLRHGKKGKRRLLIPPMSKAIKLIIQFLTVCTRMDKPWHAHTCSYNQY